MQINTHGYTWEKSVRDEEECKYGNKRPDAFEVSV